MKGGAGLPSASPTEGLFPGRANVRTLGQLNTPADRARPALDISYARCTGGGEAAALAAAAEAAAAVNKYMNGARVGSEHG